MRRLAALAVGCALACPTPAPAAPYTVDRLLALEQLGSARLDPTKRWLVVQRYARWDSAPTFDLERQTNLSLGRVQVFGLAAGGAEQPLQLPDGAGYSALGVSPDGAWLAIGRMVGRSYELGVVELASGQARWLGVTPRISHWGPDIRWRSADEVIVAALPGGWPDSQVGFGYQAQERLPKLWAAQARGEVAVTVLGSGRYRDLRPTAPKPGLVSVNVRTGQKRVLLGGAIVDFAIAPGGKTVAALVEGEDIQRINEGPKTTASAPRFRRLALVDLDAGKSTIPCFSCEVMTRFLEWSQDGGQVLAFVRQGDVPFSAGRFWRFSAQGQAAALDLKGLTPVFGSSVDTAGFPRGGWLAGSPVVFARPTGGGRADYWRITDKPPANLTGALPEGARLLGAADSAWAVAAGDQVWRVTPDKTQPWGFSPAKLVSLADPPPGFRGDQNFTPALTELGLAADAAPNLAWPGLRVPKASEGARLVDVAEAGAIEVARDAHGVETVAYRPTSGPRRTLVVVNAALAEVEAAKPVAIRHKGRDGKDVTSLLYLPTTPPAGGGKPPVVVLPYPGVTPNPAGALAPGVLYMSVNPLILAGQGYAALVPAMPYLDGREPMEGLADQMLGAVDAAAAQGLVDGDRVAVWGHSYGGYAAVAAATQTQRLRAVIATAPTVNLISAYAMLGPFGNVVPENGLHIMASTGWHETGQARMGVPPWQDPQRYLRNSPIVFADRITAPMMIIYGDADKYIEQPQNLFGALYRQNKDAIFLTYRGESHVVRSPGNVRDQYARIFAFLHETLANPSSPKSP